ncbi:hypothetical protein ON010_g13475 [Phytophthora cinnamomi]|nr:hypothetical protein ON010_g13475 [Phytophthora cinnamomi]
MISDGGDSSEEEEEQELMAVYFVLSSKRYISRRERLERPESRMEYYLTGMTEENFQLHFRMKRQYFYAVCTLIADHDVFRSTPGKQSRMSVEVHLMALLRMLGSMDGYGLAADFLSVGGHNARIVASETHNRCPSELQNQGYLSERREISARLEGVSGLLRYIELIDGTLFPLRTRPQKHGEDYYSRKASHAINGLISVTICVVFATKMLAGPDHLMTTDNEYLLGDSAYQPSIIMVSSFKTVRGSQLSAKEEGFYSQLAKIRIRVEHCFGMLKGRFPLLKYLRCRLQNKKYMLDVIRLIQSAMILHNMPINDPMPDEWIELDSDDEEWNDEQVAPETVKNDAPISGTTYSIALTKPFLR